MLRRKDLLAKRAPKTERDDDKQATSSTSSRAVTPANRGQKRQLSTSDEAQGSEYLRKKHHFIKSSIRTDYQPDICKDYKETGFCGFGDSCKFLHDRSDYKLGWQLDQEYAKGQQEDDKSYLIEDQDEDDNGTPSQCPICGEDFKDPIVTKCKHYFCGDCAEKECSQKCYTCEKPTNGIFKIAKLD